MKYYLVDNYDNIVDKIDSVTPGGAEHYFMKRNKVKITAAATTVKKRMKTKETITNRSSLKAWAVTGIDAAMGVTVTTWTILWLWTATCSGVSSLA